jgi:glycosyl hydrolase family 42 (putative beta-galactosidase)
MYPRLGGFESTHIFGRGQDILATTRHIEFWQEDLKLLLQAGITSLRYSIPWHRIEAWAGEFDWSWIDGPMQFMESAGMQPTHPEAHATARSCRACTARWRGVRSPHGIFLPMSLGANSNAGCAAICR